MSVQRIYKHVVLVIVVGVLIYFRRYIVTSLLPFFIAFVLAGLMEPGVRYFHEKLRLPRSIAVISVLTLVLVIGGYAGTLVVAKVLSELVDMSSQAGVYQAAITDLSRDVINKLAAAVDEELIPKAVQDALLGTVQDFSERGSEFTKRTIDSLLGAFAALPWLLVVTIITLISTYFISKDRALISEGILRLAPDRWRQPLSQAQEKIVVDMAGFLKAQFLLLVITTSVAAVGFYLIGIKYWMTLAIINGLLDIIPMVGPGLVFIPWAGISLLMGDLPLAIKLLVIYFAMFVTRQVLQPKVLGDSIGAHPLLMLAALYAGIVCFGVQGLIVGPVLVIIIRALLNSGLIPLWRDEEKEKTSSDAT